MAIARLRLIVDRTFDLTASRAAFEHLAAGHAFGKVAVAIAPR